MPPAKKFVAAVFALLTVTGSAHAATVNELDANVSINYFQNTVAGNIDLALNTLYPNGGAIQGGLPPYYLNASLTLNGIPIFFSEQGNTGPLGTQYFFTGVGQSADVWINTADLANLSYRDFNGATGGTVTVLSESPPSVSATPLPDALPMFGSALLALAGFAAWQSRRASRG